MTGNITDDDRYLEYEDLADDDEILILRAGAAVGKITGATLKALIVSLGGGGEGGVADGDKGDITVTGSGLVWNIDAGAVGTNELADAAVTAAKVAADVATQAELDAEAALARNADNLTSGTVADARIASTIARDSEVTAAVSDHAGATDPHGDRAYADGLAGNYATAAEGDLAATALQPADVGTAAAQDVGDFASAAQGALADSAVQPGDTVPVADGGTGSSTAAGARTNLDLYSTTETDTEIDDRIQSQTDEVGDGDYIAFDTVGGVQVPYPLPGLLYVQHNYTGVGLSNTTAETDLATNVWTIPANEIVIGTTGYEILLGGLMQNNTGSNRDMTYRVKVGSTTILTVAVTAIPTAAGQRAWSIVGVIKPINFIADIWAGVARFTLGAAGGGANFFTGTYQFSSAVDETIANDVMVTGQASSASTSLTTSMGHGFVKRLA
jgi:hypothetical protein